MADLETSPPPSATPVDRLIFVFSADSGRLAALADSARKILRINGCALCAITHGLAGEKGEWRDCKAELGVPVDYVHRDELEGELATVATALPCVVADAGGQLVSLLGPEVLERCNGQVADLKGRLVYYAGMKGLSLAAP